jgi:adenylylsulfate kinase
MPATAATKSNSERDIAVVGLVALVSPYRASRDQVRRDCELEGLVFVEVLVTAARDVLIARDVKGMYRRALLGEIDHFTGISAPYETPDRPEIIIHTDRETLSDSDARIISELRRRSLI